MFVLPTVVMGAAFLALLPDALDRTVWAVLGAHVVFNLAVVVRVVGSLWEHLPTDMEAAAATLGASRWQVATQVSLPLVRPAIVAAATIVFLFTFTSYGVIRLLAAPGTRTIEVEVWRRATQLGDIGGAAVLALIQLGVLVGLVWWSTVAQRRHARALGLLPCHRAAPRLARAASGGSSRSSQAPRCSSPPHHSSHWWSARSRPRRAGRRRRGPTSGVPRSDRGSASASIPSMRWPTRSSTRPGRRGSPWCSEPSPAWRSSLQVPLDGALDGGLMLPLATSAVTIGFGMLITFDTDPVDWRASWWLVPVGHALIAVPFVVRTCVGVLRSVDPAMTDAAATLGASPSRAWRATIVPFLWRPLAVGAALAAAISLGEFGATSLLSRSGGETMPIAIEALLGRTGSVLQAQGFVLATLLAATTVILVVVVERLQAPRPGRSRA